MNFTPLHDKIIVKRKELEEIVSQAGIVTPVQAQERPQEGTVLAIGPKVEDVKVGDTILFGKHDGQENKIEGQAVLVMRESMVWGIVSR